MEPSDYDEWLKEADVEDSEETRGWYDCSNEDRHQYIQDHPDWWDNF